MGCPVLALEVLSKIPKITKKCSSSSMSKASSKTNLNSGKPLENGTQGGVDWGSPAVSAPGNDSGAGFDWSQPVTKGEDDELKLDWGDDKDDDVGDDDDDNDDDGLTMKKPETNDGGSERGGTKLQRENSQVGLKYV